MGWEPYRPPWYPADLPEPFTSTGDSGLATGTHYEKWCAKIGTPELQRLIAEHRVSVERQAPEA